MSARRVVVLVLALVALGAPVAGSYGRPLDTDRDGMWDSLDNCPEVANQDQADADGNALGDACDPGPTQRVLVVAILGTPALDVRRLDPSSLRLEGIVPLRSALEDVSAPGSDAEVTGCGPCPASGPDGMLDLTLHFDKQQIVAAVGGIEIHACRPLVLTGSLNDRGPIVGVARAASFSRLATWCSPRDGRE